jgi:hypothetical protein
MTIQLIQFCPSLQLLQSFFRNIALKEYLTQRWMAITVSILQKKLLQSVDPKQPNNVQFSLWSIIERAGAWLFKGDTKIVKGSANWSTAMHRSWAPWSEITWAIQLCSQLQVTIDNHSKSSTFAWELRLNTPKTLKPNKYPYLSRLWYLVFKYISYAVVKHF